MPACGHNMSQTSTNKGTLILLGFARLLVPL